MKPLTQTELNKMQCGIPECKEDHQELYLHPTCHPSAGIEAMYRKEGGKLFFRCNSCKQPMSWVIQVAKSWNGGA